MEHLVRTATTLPVPAAPVLATADARLVSRLRNRGLRALLATAAGLSTQNQLRLGAVAETLSETEGLHHPHTAQL